MGSIEPDVAQAATETSPSVLRTVWHSPLYRGATAALFLSGIGVSAAAPQIAAFLHAELGASLTVAGLFYLTSLTSPLAGYLVGARSDRSGRRLNLFRLCALAGFVGWVGFALSTQLWMPFVISALVLGFAGGAASQLFAAIHDELQAKPTRVEDGVVATVRMAMTAGWVVGPVLGALLAEYLGRREMFLATGVCLLAQILPLGRQQDLPAAAHEDESLTRPLAAAPDLRTMMPLLFFTFIYICVYAGESVKYAYLPIYMNDDLHLSASIRGAVIGIQPLVELILMPVAVVVARRTGMVRLMTVAAGFGVLANICFALSSTPPGLFAGQILMGGVWGVFAALGIIVAQRLLPQAVATASAIFMSSTALSQAFGGVSGGLGVGILGLPHVFFVPMTMGIIAIVCLLLMPRVTGQDL